MSDTPRPVLVGIGLALALFLVGTVVVMISYGQGYYDGGYPLTAVFPTSSQGVFTDGGSEVKMRGVGIGTISGVELLADGRARFTLRIDKGKLVPVGATAAIEPLSIFGPKFVNIVPGPTETTGPYLRRGGEITRTATGTDATDVLDHATKLLAAIDADDLVTIFDAVSTAVRGKGVGIGRTIDASATLIDVGDRDRPLLERFLPDAAAVSASLASRRERFLELVTDLRPLATVISDRESDIAKLLSVTTTIARRGSRLLDASSSHFDVTVRALASVLQGIFDDRALVPSALDTIGAFFKMLGDPMRLPGPAGKKLTALKGFITVDLCLVYGICVLPDGKLGVSNGAPRLGTPPANGPPASSQPDTTVLTPLTDLLISNPATRAR